MTNTLASKQKYAIQIDNLLFSLFVDVTKNSTNLRLTSSLHTHSHAELFICKSGKILIETEKQTITLLSGDVAIVPSGIMHLRTPTVDPESEWTCVGFLCAECASQNTRDLYAKISRLTAIKDIAVYKEQPVLYTIIKNIADSTTLDREPSLIMDFLSVLSKLSDAIHIKDRVAKEKKVAKLKNIDRLLKLDYFINHEFMNPLTNEKIADELYLGERQLSRLVLNYYGTTLHTLLLHKRISVATKLLIESFDTVENIALAVGFNSKMSFYREFKKIYAMTPSQYRKQFSALPRDRQAKTKTAFL